MPGSHLEHHAPAVHHPTIANGASVIAVAPRRRDAAALQNWSLTVSADSPAT
jgi:hypothetical protein